MKAKLAIVAAGVLTASQSFAASVLDTASKTAITTGFTDMKDTALDVVSTSWPYFLGIMAVMFAPKIVKRLANKL